LSSGILTPCPDLEEEAVLDDCPEPVLLPAPRPPLASQPSCKPPPTLWSFRHTPPRILALARRWPSSADNQALPHSQSPTLQDIWIWLDPFLDAKTRTALSRASSAFSYGPDFSSLWLYRPWAPNRKRLWGFGRPSIDRVAAHESPSHHVIIHFIWTFLEPADRLQAIQACPYWHLYHRYRVRAAVTSLSPLRLQRAPPGNPHKLPIPRSLLYAVGLLRFNFYYGDFVRWLGGEYTNRHRNWAKTFTTLEAVCVRPPPPNLPPVDMKRGFRVGTEGVPLKGIFLSPAPALQARNAYNNHPAVVKNADAVEAKFAKEEEKSFHLHFPRSFLFFIFGLMLNPIQWAVRKGKGRICIDCTNGPDGADTNSSANTFIPGPKANDADACPPVYYATALHRHLRQLWRTRITFPIADILQHCDDIDAAFRRILYTPELAIVFAYIFGAFLLIPVGQVFGSRSAPSYFSLMSDIRAFVATCADLITGYPMHPLAVAAELPPAPLPADLAPAIADSQNLPLSQLEQDSHSNSCFVDDNGILALRTNIKNTLHNSVVAAFLLFGWPDDDRRSSCLAPDKWERDALFDMLYLGFRICSRSLTVTWPLYKRSELHDEILHAIQQRRPCMNPRAVASVIGKLRSASLIALWGPYLSYGLALALKIALQSSYSPLRRWWSRGKIWLSKSVQKDLACIADLLLEPEFSPVWSQYIGLLIPRDATHTILSDASYAGIGGWSPDFLIQWRVTRQDLIDLGFAMKIIDSYKEEPLDAASAGLHINPLEFLGCIINLWIVIKLVQNLPPRQTGYIIDLLSDNTSALSWMKLTATTRDPRLQPLARFASTLLVLASQLLTRVQSRHIPGIDNIEADFLSRSENGQVPTWGRAIAQCSRLENCRICLLPRELLSSLAGLISSGLTEATYVVLTTRLLTLACDILPLGSSLKDTTSSLQAASLPTSPSI
jgi:hypothetical protein